MTIAVQFDFDDGLYRLVVVDPRMSTMPAGPRLFRNPPHPDIAFEHIEEAPAKRDAAILQRYIDVEHKTLTRRK